MQAVAGLTAGSLALLSDAGHNLTDALALGLAMLGVYLQRKPADDSRTFGYHRGGVLAAFVNALMLVVLSLYLFVESYHRLREPQAVNETTMIWVAGVGIVLNVAIMTGLHGGRMDAVPRIRLVHSVLIGARDRHPFRKTGSVDHDSHGRRFHHRPAAESDLEPEPFSIGGTELDVSVRRRERHGGCHRCRKAKWGYGKEQEESVSHKDLPSAARLAARDNSPGRLNVCPQGC